MTAEPVDFPRPVKGGGRTVAIDFDGVIHSYTSGWTGYAPTDPPVDGALEAVLRMIAAGFRLVVMTSRADCPAGVQEVERYLAAHGFPRLRVTNVKVAAVAYIDDRAVPFHPKHAPWKDVLRDVEQLAADVRS